MLSLFLSQALQSLLGPGKLQQIFVFEICLLFDLMRGFYCRRRAIVGLDVLGPRHVLTLLCRQGTARLIARSHTSSLETGL
jgi:hypothetical protein